MRTVERTVNYFFRLADSAFSLTSPTVSSLCGALSFLLIFWFGNFWWGSFHAWIDLFCFVTMSDSKHNTLSSWKIIVWTLRGLPSKTPEVWKRTMAFQNGLQWMSGKKRRASLKQRNYLELNESEYPLQFLRGFGSWRFDYMTMKHIFMTQCSPSIHLTRYSIHADWFIFIEWMMRVTEFIFQICCKVFA